MSFQPAALDIKGTSLFTAALPLLRYSVGFSKYSSVYCSFRSFLNKQEQKVIDEDTKLVVKYIGRWGWEKQDSTLGEWMRHELQQMPGVVSYAAYTQGEETERKLEIECHTLAPITPREAFHMALQRLHKQAKQFESSLSTALPASTLPRKGTEGSLATGIGFASKPNSLIAAQATETIPTSATTGTAVAAEGTASASATSSSTTVPSAMVEK